MEVSIWTLMVAGEVVLFVIRQPMMMEVFPEGTVYRVVGDPEELEIFALVTRLKVLVAILLTPYDFILSYCKN